MESTSKQPNAASSHKEKKSKKGLIISLIIAGVIVVAGLVVLLVVLLSGPSKEDYKEAKNSAQSVVTRLGVIQNDARRVASGTGQGFVSNRIDGSLASYKDAVNELEGMKAFNDKEANKHYKDFLKKNDTFVDFIESLIADKDLLNDTSKNCSADATKNMSRDPAKIKDSYDKAVGPCIESLEKVAQSKNETLAEYGKKVVALYKEQQDLMGQMQDAYNKKDQSAYRRAASAVQQQSSKFLSLKNDDAINDKMKEIDVSADLNTLGEYLTDKANGK